MEKSRKTIIAISAALLIGIILIRPAFTEKTSATFTASCYMPFYVTTPDGEKVLAESEKERLNQNTIEVEEKNKQPTETKPALIQQEEEIVSEDQKEIKIITTVCAR